MSAPGAPGGAGPTAVVTGGSRGIGLAIAEELRAQGFRMLLVSRDPARLRAAASALDPGGLAVVPFPIDLAAPGAADAVRAEAERRLGPVELLVNNAGTATYGRLERIDPAALEREVALNLAAPVGLSRAFLPGMLERGRGHLVHLGSAITDLPMPRLATYAASKAALRAFSVALDLEVRRRGVRSTVVEPTYVRTDLGRAPGSDRSPLEELAHRHPGFVLEPIAVARAVRAALRRPRPIVRVPAHWSAVRWGALAARPLIQRTWTLDPPAKEPGED